MRERAIYGHPTSGSRPVAETGTYLVSTVIDGVVVDVVVDAGVDVEVVLDTGFESGPVNVGADCAGLSSHCDTPPWCEQVPCRC